MSDRLVYRLDNMGVSEFALMPGELLTKDGEVDFEINNQIRVNRAGKKIRIEVAIRVVTKSKRELVSKIVSYLDFYLDNMEVLEDKKTKELDIPNGFIKSINAEAMATTRGLMFYLLKGTYLDGIVLPLIDVSNVELDLNRAKS
jgi:hypothetical protein